MTLRASEWIVVAYFVYLTIAAVAAPVVAKPRWRIAGIALTVVACVLIGASFGPGAAVWRDWLPLVYVLIGYWLPALFVTRTDEALERTLLKLDYRLFGARGPAACAERLPRALTALLELTYLFCYPLVPAAFACLYVAGLRDEADRFWTAVLLAVFSCYGVLPWLPTRPPRAIEAPRTRSDGFIRRLNLHVLGRASIQLNTFPSGHAAASLAAALAVGVRLPIAGSLIGLVALGISVGSVLGRYHYVADAVAGAAAALLGFVISRIG